MPDLIFKSTLWNTAGNPPGVVVIKATDPPWLQSFWLSILTAAGFKPDGVPFAPTYEEQHYSHQDQQVPASPLSIYDYASEQSAIEVMHRFGATRVASVGKAYTEPVAFERWLVWPDGIAVNAGRLAYCFTRNPGNESVASGQCIVMIAEARLKGYTLAQAAA